MHGFIDIYSRLLIATITFPGPIVIALLSIFTEWEKRRILISKEKEAELKNQAALDLNNNNEDWKESISNTHSKIIANEKLTKKALNQLNPLIQFANIFLSLSISIILLMLNCLVRENTFNLYNHYLSISTFFFSGIAYIIALYFIVRVFYNIVKIKKKMEKK